VFREAKKLWDLLEIENNGQGGVLWSGEDSV
jgi:hypothetical protein